MKPASSDKYKSVVTRRERGLLGLLLIVVVLAYHQLVTGEQATSMLPTVVGSFFSYSGTSPQFFYLFVIGLLFIRRKDIARAYHEQGAPWSAILYLLPGVCLYLWGHYLGVIDIIHMSFLLVAWGAARLLSGKGLTRVILPPILILVLATPLPAVLLNQIIFTFQLWDAAHSAWLLNAIGIPALPEGDMILLDGKSVRFAESCTALGFLKWLTIFALAYVYIFSVPRFHALVLVLAAPVIAYAVNILRAFSLVLNPEMEILSIHTAQGIVFFLIGFSLLYAIDSILLRVLAGNGGTRNEYNVAGNPADYSARKQRTLPALVVLFTVMFLATAGMPRWIPPSPIKNNLDVTEEFGEWTLAKSSPLGYSFLGSVRYSSLLNRYYLRNNEPVALFVGYDDRLQRQKSFLSDKNGYPENMGQLEARSGINLGSSGLYARTVLTGHGFDRFLVYYWYWGVGSIGKEILYALLALDQSPFRREEPALVVRVSTGVLMYSQGLEQAEQRLQDFIADITLAELHSAASKKKGPNTRSGPSSHNE